MKNNLINSDYSNLGQAIVSSFFLDQNEKELSIFLCGGAMANGSARLKFWEVCKDEKNIIIKFPEGLFDELLEKNAYNLLELEEILADSVDAIVIFPESPGSWAELGAFAENSHLRKKIVCIAEKKFKSSFSFINLGPIRVLKKNEPSKIIDFKYSDLSDREKTKELITSVAHAAKKIKRQFPSKNIGLFRLEELIQLSLYCIDSADWSQMKQIYKNLDIGISVEKYDKIFDICINMLLIQRKIEKDGDGKFFLSDFHARQIENKIPREKIRQLQKIRVEVMNASFRRHAGLKMVRMTTLSP